MDFRTLGDDEREAVLELLDGWDVGDGWRPADFFRRYQRDDPTFAPANMHVAVEDGRLWSCVQVFPRPLRMRGRVVPCGGIGSVYTHPDRRQQGLAEVLLGRAARAMREGGMPLSLLFAMRIPWYSKLGWVSYPQPRLLLRGPSDVTSAGEPFEAARDLAEVRAIHEAYDAGLTLGVVRDDALWQASLANAGNPDERFRVVRDGAGVSAYLRTTRLSGMNNLLEVGRRAGDAVAGEALARLVAAEVGELLVAPGLHFEPGLLPALSQRGVHAQTVEDPTAMLRCLDAESLGARLGEQPAPGESGDAFLARMLGGEPFTFWTADRF